MLNRVWIAIFGAFFLLGASIASASWNFDAASRTFVLEPELVSGDLFTHTWKSDSSDPTTYIYSMNMTFATSSWYAIDPCYNLRSWVTTAGSESEADYNLKSLAGAFYGFRTTNWHSANQTDLQLDHYGAYSTDEGKNYIEYYLHENWDLGSPEGSGQGAAHSHSEQLEISERSSDLRLRYGVRELTGWDEWYGSQWRVWAGSQQTTYNDNYITSPLAGDDGGPMWDNDGLSWSNGRIENAYFGFQPMHATYFVAYENLMAGLDVRLTSTDLADTAEAVYLGTNVELRIAISQSPEGPWNDVWSASGKQTLTNTQNPGCYIDLSSNPVSKVFVKIYTVDGGSHYARWGGFHVAVTPYKAASCDDVWNMGLGISQDLNHDCIVDLSDLAILFLDWGKEQLVLDDRNYVIEDFESQRAWRWGNAHSGSPVRPLGGMEIVDEAPYRGSYCGAFDYDTGETVDGMVVSSLNEVFPIHAKQLSFWTRTDGAADLSVQIIDATGQQHTSDIAQTSSGWHQVVLSLKDTWGSYTGGANDGFIYQPIKSLQIIREVDNSSGSGAIYLDDISLTVAADDSVLLASYWDNWQGRFGVNDPGNLCLLGEVSGSVVVTPPAVEGIEFSVTGNIYNAADELVASLTPVLLNAANGYGSSIDIPEQLNFYRVEIEVVDVANADHKIEIESRYAVIPSNDAMAYKEYNSPFGVNCHFNHWWPNEVGTIVKHAGIGWVRDTGQPGTDLCIAVATKNKLCYMNCFTRWTSDLATMFAETLAIDPDFPRSGTGSWDYTEQIEWHTDYATQYADQVDAYDLMNEPHGLWSAALGGGWWGGEWLETFSDYGSQITQALRQADPTATIIWEDVDHLNWYDEYYSYGVADYIDVISPHPYNLSRTVSDPEDQTVMTQGAEWYGFINNNSLPWKVWSGEVGFSSYILDPDNPPTYYADHTELGQAGHLVRMMIVQLAWGVERIFWYDFMNDGTEINNPEHNFGLINRDLLPKPAVVAYAYLINRLKGYDTLESYSIGTDGNVYGYVSKRDNVPVLIIWAKETNETVTMPILSGVNEVSVSDIFGHSSTMSITNGQLQLNLTDVPMYIDGLTLADFPDLAD